MTSFITSRRIDVFENMKFLNHHLKAHFLVFEVLVDGLIGDACADYESDTPLVMYELSNDGFFMAPGVDHPLRVFKASNGFDEELAPDVIGILVTLLVLDHMAQDPKSEFLGDKIQPLTAYAQQHADIKAMDRFFAN